MNAPPCPHRQTLNSLAPHRRFRPAAAGLLALCLATTAIAAAMSNPAPYTADWDSLATHPMPEWLL